MRPTQPAARILAAIALAAVAAVAVLWLTARTRLAREWLGGRLTELAGLPVAIGDLDMSFLPRLGLAIGRLTVAQPPGFGTEPLIEVAHARVDLPWRSLFGVTRLQGVTVEDAMVRLAVDADGRDNWSDLLARLSADQDQGPADWSLGELSIEHGRLAYRDPAATVELTAITVAASDIAPRADFPLDLRLAALAGPHTFHFGAAGRGHLDPDADRYGATDLVLRGWAGGGSLPIAGVELGGAIAVVTFDTAANSFRIEQGRFTIAGVRGAWQADGRFGDEGTEVNFAVDTEVFAPRPVAVAFGHPLPETADPAAFGQAQLSVRGRWLSDGLMLDLMAGLIDDTHFTGRAAAAQRQIRLHADRMDIDRYLAPGEPSRRSKQATLEAAIRELGALDIDAELRIDEARVAGARLQDAVVLIERSGDAP